MFSLFLAIQFLSQFHPLKILLGSFSTIILLGLFYPFIGLEYYCFYSLWIQTQLFYGLLSRDIVYTSILNFAKFQSRDLSYGLNKFLIDNFMVVLWIYLTITIWLWPFWFTKQFEKLGVYDRIGFYIEEKN